MAKFCENKAMLTTPSAKKLALELEAVIQREAPLLRAFSDTHAEHRPRAGGWSRKEELGHLIDSAVNNHMHFVRAPLAETFEGPGYAQDAWVKAHGYHEFAWTKLIEWWAQHNSLLVAVTARIADEKLATPCRIGASEPVTLGFVIEDYILHMQHHLDQIIGRERITAYPSAAQPD